jgi:hypothetical protein
MCNINYYNIYFIIVINVRWKNVFIRLPMYRNEQKFLENLKYLKTHQQSSKK